MKPPEEVKRELAKQWLAKAEEDLGVAKTLLSKEVPYFSAIAFHCQQSAEKFLKAYLTLHQIEFPKTHDLIKLVNLSALVNSSFAIRLNEISLLNPYGVDIRYPGDVPIMTRKNAEDAFNVAEKVRDMILAALQGLL
ncbi:MAG: HEPN domain-containing protein [Planctomycetes bacterium]|nr:HEPN domain-containing protein [Planctomycetota bacterium]